MQIYEHKAQYYETDQMGIIHHSNYIRWMEEARIDALNQINWPMDKIEAMGVISPILEVNCKYKHMVYFNETVVIKIWLKDIGKIKFDLVYEIVNKETGQVCVSGESKHCFLHKDGTPVVIPRELPEIYEALNTLK